MLAVDGGTATLVVGFGGMMLTILGAAFYLGRGQGRLETKVTPNGGNTPNLGDVALRAEEHARQATAAVGELRQEFQRWTDVHSTEDTKRFDEMSADLKTIGEAVDRRRGWWKR